MPFGLRNTPSTFQALMNRLFGKLLRKFVLFFFDDILVYSADRELHQLYLQKVFEILTTNQLSIHLKKCQLGQEKNYISRTLDFKARSDG